MCTTSHVETPGNPQERCAGLELGVWAFAANLVTLFGFSRTSATMGAFLLQCSALFTPMCSCLLAKSRPPPPSLYAAGLAFLGASLIFAGKLVSSGGTLHKLGLSGALLILLAAAIWSIQIVRQGQVCAMLLCTLTTLPTGCDPY
jgi:drug/metabolite transporter (DMT)-like permease